MMSNEVMEAEIQGLRHEVDLLKQVVTNLHEVSGRLIEAAQIHQNLLASHEAILNGMNLLGSA